MPMIEWARKRLDGTVEYAQDGTIKCVERSFCSWLNHLCVDNYSTLDGRIKAIKSRYGFRRLTPIFVGCSILLMPMRGLRANDAIVINSYAITGFERSGPKGITVYFSYAKPLVLPSWHIFRSQCEKAKLIDEQFRKMNG